MGQAIGITRQYDAGALRKLARRERDGRVASRLLAIASVLDGVNRTDAARQAGMDRQTLRDWVHRFNSQGLAGLRDAPRGRPLRRLTAAQEAEVRARVMAGPDPQADGLVRWRCTDVQRFIAETYQVRYHVRSIGKLLHKLKLSHVSVRPVHPESDVAAQEAFKKTSPPGLTPLSRTMRTANRLKSGCRTKPVSARKAR